MLLVALLLATAAPTSAATPFGLPAEEPTQAWDLALADVGFVAGAAEGPGAWARLERAAGGCTLLVSTGRGTVERDAVPCPTDEADRENLAALAAVMVAQLVSVAVPPMPPTPASPPPAVIATHRAAPTRPASLPGRPARPPGSAALDPTPTAAPPTTPGPLEIFPTEAPPAPPPLESSPPVARDPGREGAWNVRTSLCVIDFDLPCATTARCSTAERCPGIWFFDHDGDGYSDGTLSKSAAELTRVMRDHYVQVVGDLDDLDPLVHPVPE